MLVRQRLYWYLVLGLATSIGKVLYLNENTENLYKQVQGNLSRSPGLNFNFEDFFFLVLVFVLF